MISRETSSHCPDQPKPSVFLSSTTITEALKEAIRQQDFQYTGEFVARQLKVKTVLEVHKLRQEQTRLVSEQLKASLPTLSSSPWTLFKKKELHPGDYLRS